VSVVRFYNWQKVFFENGAAAFERKLNSANVKRQEDANLAKIEVLDYIRKWSEKTKVIGGQIQKWIAIWSCTYCSWVRNTDLRCFCQSAWNNCEYSISISGEVGRRSRRRFQRQILWKRKR